MPGLRIMSLVTGP